MLEKRACLKESVLKSEGGLKKGGVLESRVCWKEGVSERESVFKKRNN